MSVSELRAEIAIEFAQLALVVAELQALRCDVGGRAPTIREKVAAGAFLMQFYTGVEKLLKRVSKHARVALPQGRGWHVELFRRFCDPPAPGLPLLFDNALRDEMRRYRGFRHIVRESYGTELDWAKVVVGIDRVEVTFERFREAVDRYLEMLQQY